MGKFRVYLLLVLGLGCCCLDMVRAAEPQAGSPIGPTVRTAEQALNSEVAWDFADTPLADALAIASQQAGVPILIDRTALAAGNMPTPVKLTTPMTLRLRKVKLATALDRLLTPLQCNYVVIDGALQVSTAEALAERYEMRLYPVGDLVAGRLPLGSVVVVNGDAYDHLTRLLTMLDGSDRLLGTIQLLRERQALLVNHNVLAQRRMGRYLAGLRRAMAISTVAVVQPPADQEAATEQHKDDGLFHIELGGGSVGALATLDRQVKLSVDNLPLQQALQQLADQTDANIDIDETMFEEAGIDPNQPVAVDFRGISLRSALQLLLKPLGCAMRTADGVIHVTTQEDAEATLVTRFYPVRDLIDGVRESDDVSEISGDRYHELAVLMTRSVEPTTWENVGGPGAIDIQRASGTLVISQTDEIHEQIISLLKSLRRLLQEHPVPHEPIPADKQLTKVYVLAGYDPDPEFGGGMAGMPHGMAEFPTEQDRQRKQQQEQLKFNHRQQKALALVQSIPAIVAPETWTIVHGKGSLVAHEDKLIVRQTLAVHEELQRLLIRLVSNK